MYHRSVVKAGTFSKLNKSSTAIGLRWGTSTKALASHQCGPGSIQSPIRRLMWVEFIGALCCYEWFSSGFSGFPLFPSSTSQWSLKKVWSSGIFFSGAEYQGSRFWRFAQGTLSPGINFKLPVDFSTISAWRICHSKRLLIPLKEISWNIMNFLSLETFRRHLVCHITFVVDFSCYCDWSRRKKSFYCYFRLFYFVRN